MRSRITFKALVVCGFGLLALATPPKLQAGALEDEICGNSCTGHALCEEVSPSTCAHIGCSGYLPGCAEAVPNCANAFVICSN
jgi:hypothetical protein